MVWCYWINMFTLSLSVLIFVAVNDFTWGERVQERSKCLSTLKDIQEAYLRGDYYPTNVENSVFDLDSVHRYQRGVAMTTGFYRLTYQSQGGNISHTDLDDFKKCCYPDEDNNSCVMIVILNSPLFAFLHPLLLHFFSIPRNVFSILLNGKVPVPGGRTRGSLFGVTCWNLPPVCDNASSNIERSLVYFTVQFEGMAKYGHPVSSMTGYQRFVSGNYKNQVICNDWFRNCGKKYVMIVLPAAIVFTIGPLTLQLVNERKSYLKGVIKHSTFARHFLYSVMITSVIGALYMYTGLVMSINIFSNILYSENYYNSELFHSDVVVGVSSVSMVTIAIITQFPFDFYYFWKHFSSNATKPLIKVATCVGWCWVVEFVKILSFYAFHLLVLLIINPVMSVIQTCLTLSLILTGIMILLSIFTCCRPPYCSIGKCSKLSLAVFWSLTADMLLYLLTEMYGSLEAPNTHGVNMVGVIFSLASSTILSKFVYFLKKYVQQKIRGEMNLLELHPLVQYIHID